MSTDAIGQLQTAIDEVRKSCAADILLFAGPLAYQSERRLNEIVRTHRSRENLLLLVATFGGSADVAYQVVRCLHRNYSKFILFVDSICKSAGTLMALGAHEIIMSDTAEMGPLDVQVQKPGELGEYVSGLTSSQALDTLRSEVFSAFEDYFLKLRYRSGLQISTKMAAEMALRIAIGAFRPIYAQLDPMRLADNTRANMIAYEYGKRIKTENVKDETIERLIRDYPFHGFVIDREEAKELFNEVRAPAEAESKLADFFRRPAEQALEQAEPIIQPLWFPVGRGDSDEHFVGETGEVSEAPSADHRQTHEEAGTTTDPEHDAEGASRGPRDTATDSQPKVTGDDEIPGAASK